MARKKVNPNEKLQGECPRTINDHPFYGLKLDPEQIEFVNAILNPEKLIVFCNAKAGTGKSLMAVAAANLLVQHGLYDTITYVISPIAEGRSGFLPGSIEEKMNPYFQPLYSAMATLGLNPFTTLMQSNIENEKRGEAYINAVSHLHMRGCNLTNSVVIIEEAQNNYTDELKKILTRVSDSSKVICIGHTGQCDLYHHPENSGFARYIEHFDGQPFAQICELKTNHRGLVSSWADEL